MLAIIVWSVIVVIVIAGMGTLLLASIVNEDAWENGDYDRE